VRELREFRAHHAEYVAAGVTVAGVSLDSSDINQEWVGRLELPYPLLSDREREAGKAFGLLRHVGIGGWSIELLRRATVLIAPDQHVAAIWNRIKIRGHAGEVLKVARMLAADGRLPG
jgi:thioredoxin-dependent peroxiredoxin